MYNLLNKLILLKLHFLSNIKLILYLKYFEIKVAKTFITFKNIAEPIKVFIGKI